MDLIKYFISSVKLWFFNNESLDYIQENVTWWQACLSLFSLSFLLFFIGVFINSSIYFELLGSITGSSILFLVLFFLFGIFILLPIIYFVTLGMIHLFLLIFGGKAKFSDTVKFFFSIYLLPTIIFSLFSIIQTFLASLNQALLVFFSFFYVLFILCFLIWIIILMVYIFSKLHNISILRTVFAVIVLPFLLFLVLLSILFVVIFLSVMSEDLYKFNDDSVTLNGNLKADPLSSMAFSFNDTNYPNQIFIGFTYTGARRVEIDANYDLNDIIISGKTTCDMVAIYNLDTRINSTANKSSVSFLNGFKGVAAFDCSDSPLIGGELLTGDIRIYLQDPKSGLSIPSSGSFRFEVINSLY